VWCPKDSNLHSYRSDRLKYHIHFLKKFTGRAVIRGLVAGFLWRKHDSILSHSIWDLLWAKRHWDRVIFEYMGLSVSVHQSFVFVFIHLPSTVNSRGSSFGIVTKLQAGRTRNRGSIPGRAKRFVSSPKRPDLLVARPASYSVGNKGFFPGDKAAAPWS
jgi:hypothetical protein